MSPVSKNDIFVIGAIAELALRLVRLAKRMAKDNGVTDEELDAKMADLDGNLAKWGGAKEGEGTNGPSEV